MMSDYMPKCATCEHFESCIIQKHITEMALILWNISREKEKERTVNKPRRKRERVMTKEEQFVNELIGYIFAYPDDDYMTMECLCRKLHKYGLVDKKDGFYLVADDTLRKTEPTISKMEQVEDEPSGYNLSPVDKDINVRSKTEPQTEREGE